MSALVRLVLILTALTAGPVNFNGVAGEEQVSRYCSFLGPVFAPASNAMHHSAAVPAALDTFRTSLQNWLQNGKLKASNISFFLSTVVCFPSIADCQCVREVAFGCRGRLSHHHR